MPGIDFGNAADFNGVQADPNSLPPSGVPPIGVPAIPPIPQKPANPLPVAPQVATAFAPPAAPVAAPLPAPVAVEATPAAAPAAPAPKPHVTVPAAASLPQPTAALQASAEKVNEADRAHADAMAATGETEQANAENEAEARDKAARDLKTQQALQSMDRQEAETKVQQARDAAKAKKFTGIFEGDHGAARLIATGIAQILGSLSFDANHVNQVTKQIDDAIRMHFQTQEAEKADLWRDVQAAMDQKQALRADQLQEMGDFRANQAAALDAVISKGKALSALSKNKEGVAAIEANNARLGFERDKAIDEAKRLYIAQAEKHRLDSSEIAKNYAQAEHARAAAGTEKTTANQLKVDKFTESYLKPDVTEAHGTSRSPGPVTMRDKARAIQKDIAEAVASKDPLQIKAAIASAREQTSNILTGSAATKTSTHLVTELQSSLDKATSFVSTLAGSPTEGAHFVKGIQTLVAGIEKQQTERIEEQRKRTIAKAKSSNAWKNPDLRAGLEARINAIYGEPEAAAPEIPAGWTAAGTSGGKPVYKSPDGKLHVAQ